MTMKFGLVVPQGWQLDLAGIPDPAEAYETMTRVALEAEALGYDSVWLYDHLHTVPMPSQEVTFECWTGMAGLARDTKRVRIGQIVTCNNYRNPALLAKMASCVDVMSHGRLNFGIGAGWYEHEYRAYGYDYPDAPARLRQMGEAVQIFLKMWTEDEASFEGKYYQVRGAINQPKGVQKPHIPLLIGGGGEKVTLKLVAQYADACNVSDSDVPVVEHKFAVLKKHCEDVERDYNSIRRTFLIDCRIAETDQDAIAKLKPEQQGQLDMLRRQSLIGTPDTIRKRLAEYEQVGVQEVIMYMPDARDLKSVRLFAQECMRSKI